MRKSRFWCVASVLAGMAVAAVADDDAGIPSIRSLQELDADCETLRHSIWDFYDWSRINGEDLRGRTVAQDIADWVMTAATRAQVDALRPGITAGNTKAISDANAILTQQTRRLAAIDAYWTFAWYVKRQRGLWMGWANLLPDSMTHDGRARLEVLERAVIDSFNPDMEAGAQQSSPAHDLLIAYDEERGKLSKSANAVLGQQQTERSTFERDIPCADTGGPVKVDDSQSRPVKVLHVPPLESYYPPETRHAFSSGLVEIRLDIDATGCVLRSTVMSSAGDPLLDAAALRFGEHIELRPAIQDGAPVAISVKLPIRFVLHDAPTGISPR